MNDSFKNFAIWAVVLVALLLVFSEFMPRGAQPAELAYSDFLAKVRSGDVSEVTLQGGMIYALDKNQSKLKVHNPETDRRAHV